MIKKYLISILLLLMLSACTFRKYTVKFIDDNKEILTLEVKKGDNLQNIPTPEKDGYIFLNWLKDGLEYNVNNPVTEDMTLEATWIEAPDPVKTYTVTLNFGNETKTVSVKEGDKLAVPKKIPRKEKHKFIGWYDGETLYNFDNPVTKDFILIAKFEKNRITINYDLDGGTGVLEVEIEKDTIPDKPKNPTKFGYTFNGWAINGETYNFDKPLTKDTTIKAIFEANVYVKVTFDTDGGNEIASRMLISGEVLRDLPVAEKNGYQFLYWTYNQEKYDPTMKIDKDITLIAYYEEKEANE